MTNSFANGMAADKWLIECTLLRRLGGPRPRSGNVQIIWRALVEEETMTILWNLPSSTICKASSITNIKLPFDKSFFNSIFHNMTLAWRCGCASLRTANGRISSKLWICFNGDVSSFFFSLEWFSQMEFATIGNIWRDFVRFTWRVVLLVGDHWSMGSLANSKGNFASGESLLGRDFPSGIDHSCSS